MRTIIVKQPSKKNYNKYYAYFESDFVEGHATKQLAFNCCVRAR